MTMALGIGSGRYAPVPTRRELDVDHLIAMLFQDAREGVLVVDADGRVVASNRAAAALLGIEEGRLTAQARCSSILRCSENETCPLVLDAGASRRARSGRMSFDCVVRDKKGERVVLASCHRLPKSSGVLRGMILIRDIAAQKAAETALIEMANGR
jgi:PAS domain S-box-containing protein